MKKRILMIVILFTLISCKKNSEQNNDLISNLQINESNTTILAESFQERMRSAQSNLKGALSVHFAGSNNTISEFQDKYNNCKPNLDGLTCAFYAQSDYTLEIFKKRVDEGENKLSHKSLRLHYAISKYSIAEFENRITEWKNLYPKEKPVAYYFAQSKYTPKVFKERLELGKATLQRGEQYIFASSDHEI